MYTIKKIIPLCILLLLAGVCVSQPRVSLATGVSVLRNLEKTQRYWTLGQDIIGHMHFTPRNGAYFSFSYFRAGSFKNQLTAHANSSTTLPQEIDYVNKTKQVLNYLSIGWRHYFKGAYNSEKSWNAYSIAGLGILMGKLTTQHSIDIDTFSYIVPVLGGKGRFKRLTLDLGLGIEQPVGGDIFIYTEVKTFIPVSYFPSRYLLNSKYTPLTASLAFGLRILFE